MLDRVHHLVSAVPDGLHAALVAVQEPGFADKAGAFAIGAVVLACWLFASAPGRAR